MFAHAMGHNVFRGTAGAAVGVNGGWGRFRKEGGEKKTSEGVWWPHVAVAAQRLDIAGFGAKYQLKIKTHLAKYKGWLVDWCKRAPRRDLYPQRYPSDPASVLSGPTVNPDLQPRLRTFGSNQPRDSVTITGMESGVDYYI